MRKPAIAAALAALTASAGCASAPAATRFMPNGQACAGVYRNFEYQQPRIEQLANDPRVDPSLRAAFRKFVHVVVDNEATSTQQQRKAAFAAVDRVCGASQSQANW
ncbi:MAG TPA: hypothetical protein VGS19_09120 [Streptosporangiaceae bacterium]|nr:hypothetical protein [Streptosporangiaceae bacterium]